VLLFIGYWHDTVISPSVHLPVKKRIVAERYKYSKGVWTSK